MNWEESTINKEKGQSLVELLIAMSIFVLTVSVVTFLILGVYLADRVGRERTKATFLAQEGMEAARSIRDNNWNDLTAGSYGLTISGGYWIFQGAEENISDQLKEGIRRIIIENIDTDRRKVTSQVSWRLTEARSQEVLLISYLTNWSKIGLPATCDLACQWEDYSGGSCQSQRACPDPNELGGLGEYGCSAKKVCCCE